MCLSYIHNEFAWDAIYFFVLLQHDAGGSTCRNYDWDSCIVVLYFFVSQPNGHYLKGITNGSKTTWPYPIGKTRHRPSEQPPKLDINFLIF